MSRKSVLFSFSIDGFRWLSGETVFLGPGRFNRPFFPSKYNLTLSRAKPQSFFISPLNVNIQTQK